MKACPRCHAMIALDATVCSHCHYLLKGIVQPPALSMPRIDPPGPVSLPRLADDTSEETPDPMIGSQIAQYRLEALLGQGGFGNVYRAVHLTQRRQLALKLMHPREAQNSNKRARFQREAQMMSILRHKHVVQSYDFGALPNGSYYLVMEYLEGETLQDAYNRERVFTIRELKQLTQQICSALHYIHGQGIIHRDLKMGNIFLESRFETIHSKLIDFGIAFQDDATPLTEEGIFLGTAHFMSPEQIIGRHELDGRSDLYSFSIILYALLTQKIPFQGSNITSTIYQQAHLPHPPLGESAPSIRWCSQLESFFEAALAKDREERPLDAEEYLSRCLEALSAQEKNSSSPSSPSLLPITTPLQQQEGWTPLRFDPGDDEEWEQDFDSTNDWTPDSEADRTTLHPPTDSGGWQPPTSSPFSPRQTPAPASQASFEQTTVGPLPSLDEITASGHNDYNTNEHSEQTVFEFHSPFVESTPTQPAGKTSPSVAGVEEADLYTDEHEKSSFDDDVVNDGDVTYIQDLQGRPHYTPPHDKSSVWNEDKTDTNLQRRHPPKSKK